VSDGFDSMRFVEESLTHRRQSSAGAVLAAG
jgi:hypothetical protein